MTPEQLKKLKELLEEYGSCWADSCEGFAGSSMSYRLFILNKSEQDIIDYVNSLIK